MSFDRKTERTPDTKAFSIDTDDLTSRSMNQKFNAFPEYKLAKEVQNACMQYAWAYSETMMTRIEQENPSVYEEKGMSKAELCTYLANNMCTNTDKYHSRVFRDTVAKIHEKEHLQDTVRRLVNGGHKFHPYF